MPCVTAGRPASRGQPARAAGGSSRWASTRTGCGSAAPAALLPRPSPAAGAGPCAARGAPWNPSRPGGPGGGLPAGACRRCHLYEQLRRLLADPATGRTRTGLDTLRQALAEVERPEAALGWLRRPKVKALLADLA